MSLDYLNHPSPARGTVIPLIGGVEYFNDFMGRLESLGEGDRVFLMNWMIDHDFELDGVGPLYDKLVELIDNGVDVRVLLWINTNYLQPVYPDWIAKRAIGTPPLFHRQMLQNIETVREWRSPFPAVGSVSAASKLADSLIINTLDAPTGGCHAKFCLVLDRLDDGNYEGFGYTGGIDFAHGRYGIPGHAANWDGWHDVQARVHGPEILSQLVKFYTDMWNENIHRRDLQIASPLPLRDRIRVAPESSYPDGPDAPPEPPGTYDCVPDGALPIDFSEFTFGPTPGHPHRIQSLRTIPDIYPLLGEREISFATEGAFEFRDALRHAIEKARHYIYIEDQAMESQEIFGWLLSALKSNAALRVILLTGASDPGDPPSKDIGRTLVDWWFYGQLQQTERDRFHYFEATGYVVHSKVFIVDDVFAIIGSAGMFTRSLTQELEHAVSFVGEGSDHQVRELRESLWAELLNWDVVDYRARHQTLAEALKTWDPRISHVGRDVALPTYATRLAQAPDSFQTEIPFDGPGGSPIAVARDAAGELDSITDSRLPLADEKNLAELSAVVRCAQGANTGQVRLVLAHEGRMITVAAFDNLPDGSFQYVVALPAVREVDLPRYGLAKNYEDDTTELLHDIAFQLLFMEVPFHSLFNPSEIGDMAVPLPIGEPVAVHQIVELTFLALPTTDVAWECDEPDATPTSGSGITFAVQFGTHGKKQVRTIHDVPHGGPIVYEYAIDVLENSGPQWQPRFMFSTDLADLEEPFRQRVTEFLVALDDAGVGYTIKTTRRPAQRAYLMTWAFAIAREGQDPTQIDDRRGDVPISWVHHGADGQPDLVASKAAAEAMVVAYGIDPRSGASRTSRHIFGTAIDVVIPLAPAVEVRMKGGALLRLSSEQRLTRIGRSYGLRRLRHTNHWSLSGH